MVNSIYGVCPGQIEAVGRGADDLAALSAQEGRARRPAWSCRRRAAVDGEPQLVRGRGLDRLSQPTKELAAGAFVRGLPPAPCRDVALSGLMRAVKPSCPASSGSGAVI